MDRQYVGIDFHRRRSVIVRKNAAGELLSSVRVANEPLVIAAAVAEAGPEPEVVIEATYGWYWIVDWLQEQGATVHLANPSGLNWGTRRVKNDERDAIDLIDMLRLGRLPEAWIAPPATRELRELVRYRAKLVASVGTQSPGPCGDGQRRRPANGHGHVLSRGQRPAQRDGTRRRVHHPRRITTRLDRGLRP
jgi:transposase